MIFHVSQIVSKHVEDALWYKTDSTKNLGTNEKKYRDKVYMHGLADTVHVLLPILQASCIRVVSSLEAIKTMRTVSQAA